MLGLPSILSDHNIQQSRNCDEKPLQDPAINFAHVIDEEPKND